MKHFQGFGQGILDDAQTEAILDRGLPWLGVAAWAFLVSLSYTLAG
jgi:hypothetical protein